MDFHGSHSSNLTPTGLAHKLIAELTSLANLLSPNMRRIIKKFGDYILQYRSAISDATNLLPLEAALVVIQVEEHANTLYEISELHKRIDALERKIDTLTTLE
jgi:uncharacterized protein Yka (UPF0111/DUF47 family)